jgi:hypothetical protein
MDAWTYRYSGNKRAINLVKEIAGTNSPGPEPFCGISKNLVRSAMKAWLDAKLADCWCPTHVGDPVRDETKTLQRKHNPDFQPEKA